MTTNKTFLAVFLGSHTNPRAQAWRAPPDTEREAKQQEGFLAWRWLGRPAPGGDREQQKTSRPVQFELLEPARTSMLAWLGRREGNGDDFVFPSRVARTVLGHTNIENTVRYPGVDVEDALALAEGTEV